MLLNLRSFVVKLRYPIFVAILWSAFSIPAISQHIGKPFYLQVSYGQSFFSSNTSPRYTFICPEVKLGVGFRKEWRRFGVNTGLVAGMRFSTEKDFSYQMFIREEKLYMLATERTYSNGAEFLEMPLTMFYYIIKQRLSFHAGFSARRYFTNVSPSNYQNYFEEIADDRYNAGVVSMLMFDVGRHIDISVDYFRGLKRLNSTTSVSSDAQYYLRGDFVQFSFFLNPLIFKTKRD
jgi:hypothetical protein